MVGDRWVAEDIVQEAFIKVFEKIDQYEGRSTPGAWIKRIVINHSLNTIRKQKKIRFESLDEEVEFEEETIEEVPQLEPEKIHEAVKHLPEGARIIVSLHLLEGLKHREITEQLDISVSTSRSQYFRGRNLLREALANQIKYGE
jgi:RNA polymerase sigma-70 factor (ECF subfamily)